jgi:hypothetical protein
MTEPKKDKQDTQDSYRIDYDNIDIDDIMRQIKARSESEPAQKEEPQGSAGAGEPAPPPPQEMGFLPETEEEPGPPPPGRVKSILLKLMRPFTPLIKLMILPVHRQLVEAVYHIDRTNRRLDRFDQNVSRELLQISRALTRLEKRVDKFERFTHESIDKTFRDLEQLFAETGRIKEYTKLIHALEHNLVVELTKLKIESDTLKVQTRIMEKDFVLLKKRERVLEDKVFK